MIKTLIVALMSLGAGMLWGSTLSKRTAQAGMIVCFLISIILIGLILLGEIN